MKNQIKLSKKQLKSKTVVVAAYNQPGKSVRIPKGGAFTDNVNNESIDLNEVSNLNLSDKDQRFIKKESKKMNAIKSITGIMHYLNNALMMKKGRQRDLIIMLAVTNTIKAKLAMPTNDDEYYRKSFNMQEAIFNNTDGYFTPAFGRLATWAAENILLDTALDALRNKLPNGEALKITAMAKLKLTLKLALNFVNDIVLQDQPRALLIIVAALMEPVGVGTRNRLELTVKQTDVSGSIKLFAIVPRRDNKKVQAAYEWEFSIDNGDTWVRLPITLSASTTAVGMETGKITLFRRKITTRQGGGEWAVSRPITPA